MSPPFQYTSTCHCKLISLTFTTDQNLRTKEFILCNCSICTKNGYINHYVPKSDMAFLSGENALSVRSSPIQLAQKKEQELMLSHVGI
jgi:hypothetical protein